MFCVRVWVNDEDDDDDDDGNDDDDNIVVCVWKSILKMVVGVSTFTK